jgi:hypothetical protein
MTTEHLTKVEDVIEKLGGPEKVAKRYGVNSRAVYYWQQRDRFPADTYLSIKETLAEVGCDAPASLWNFRTEATAQ